MINVDGLAVRAGSFAIEGIQFEIPSGMYGILMGQTGCGKTTVLESICGLRRVAGGTIVLDSRDVTRLKAAERNVGYVPQDQALFTTMTVRDHLAFSMRIRKAKPSVINDRVDEMADLLGLEKLMDRTPQGLSGGEAQRVALGRALASHPATLCLDEPLSALDEAMRYEMYELLESIQSKTEVTVLHVTHSRSEALRLGDRVLLMENGSVQEVEPSCIVDPLGDGGGSNDFGS